MTRTDGRVFECCDFHKHGGLSTISCRPFDRTPSEQAHRHLLPAWYPRVEEGGVMEPIECAHCGREITSELPVLVAPPFAKQYGVPAGHYHQECFEDCLTPEWTCAECGAVIDESDQWWVVEETNRDYQDGEVENMPYHKACAPKRWDGSLFGAATPQCETCCKVRAECKCR